MEKIYIIEEQKMEYEFDEWEGFETVPYSNVIGYTDSLEEAQFVKDNYGTENEIVINEYPYLNKEILIEEQRYYKYWFNIELKRNNGYFNVNEVSDVERKEIFKNDKRDINFNELNLHVSDIACYEKNRICVFVELCLLNDKEEAFVQQKRDNLVQKIQFLLKHSIKANIRSKKEIISAIEKLEE
ncbi:TPA: hypothetical protein I1774_000612 [Staphylococcus pseudintermedius]|nr:hypothetical protein [Staphylococcus pseudintermedius]HAR6353848.1 hypothetical protein [Staphylococcus pseudintermedius]HCT0573108.1 hypothetical protein [Staphylococcus pseudintermedius]